MGKVISVNISDIKGVIKRPVDEILIDMQGVAHDAHAGYWHRQVSLLSQESIEVFSKELNQTIQPGEFAENITTEGLDLTRAAILDSFEIGQVKLEVTQIGKKCHGDGCAIFQQVGKCVMPKQGIFCRVVQGGKIKPGDCINFFSRPLVISIFTMSDRAFSGQYTDRSGPHARAILEKFFDKKPWHPQFESVLLPDDREALSEAMQRAIGQCADIVFTLGGTGVGPRDITPETVMSHCEKMIPGIMENIRIKYGQAHPQALLSRGIAAICGKTQVYTLPGSARAVEEYLSEITKTLEHTIVMLHGIDSH